MPIRSVASLVVAAATFLAFAACGSERRAASSGQRPLASLVLKPSEAPPGTRYVPQISGRGILERQGATTQVVNRLRSYGFESDFGRQFYSTNPRKLFSVSSVAARFRSSRGASQGLGLLKQELRKVHPLATPLPPARLGEEAWGYGGRLFTNAPPAYRSFYIAWRRDDLIFTVSMSGPKRIVTLHAARALATKIVART
jgi:hypothetical protein